MSKLVTRREVEINDPPFARFIFADTRFSIVWLVVRLWLSYQWLSSGFGKLSNPAWVDTGAALKGFWTAALQTAPKPVIYFDWYRQFIQYMVDIQAWTWFAKLVTAGELLVGLGLLLGAFTGIAAFFGGVLNWNFMLAGTASSNPVLFAAAVLLIMAWKTAGYIGLDRWLLPLLGTPWRPALVVNRPESVRPVAEPVNNR